MARAWPWTSRRRTAKGRPRARPRRETGHRPLRAARRESGCRPSCRSIVSRGLAKRARASPSLASMLARIFPDRFVPVLLATILLASLLPVRGSAVPIAQGASTAAIVFLVLPERRAPAARRGIARHPQLEIAGRRLPLLFRRDGVARARRAARGRALASRNARARLPLLGILPSTRPVGETAASSAPPAATSRRASSRRHCSTSPA